MITKFINSRKFSSYLERLYHNSKINNTPYFTVDSNQIEILNDPLQYYTAIIKGINASYTRIGLSSLYLGTGTLQRYILYTMNNKIKKVPRLNSVMVYDWNRSKRKQYGDSSVDILTEFYMKIQQSDRINHQIAFYQNSKDKGVLGQISGVHHQKICIFDDTIIIGGANLSKNYFLNRKDRYMKIKDCHQLSNYLYDYLSIIAQNSKKFMPQKDQPFKQKNSNLQTHYNLWKFNFTPEEYKQTFAEQEKYLHQLNQQRIFQEKRGKQNLDNQEKSRNIQLAEMLGTQIQIKQEVQDQIRKQRIQKTRQKLFTAHQQAYLGNYLDLIDFKQQSNITKKGQKVYIFPFISNSALKEHQYKVFEDMIKLAVQNKHQIRIASGYMNFPHQLVKIMSHTQIPSQVLCSSPQANSFFRGGFLKKYIPHFYRAFQAKILQAYKQKFLIKQFVTASWSFHAKGVWIKQSENSYLTVIGSSNFNARSRNRDTQMQFYLYSTCEQMNVNLDKQWKQKQQNCKQINLEHIYNDPQTKVNMFIKFFAKIFGRYL